MFVSGPRPVRVGKAGQEADGGEVGGGGGGVGLRGEAARRSGAASEVAVWACGVAAAARAAATAPGLRLFVLGALGGVAGVWEARESGVWCRRFSAEPEGERMRTSGLLWAPAAEARRGPEHRGSGAVLSWGRGRRPSGPASKRSRRLVRAASAAHSPSCRRAAAGEVPPAHAFRHVLRRACSAAPGACVRSTLAPRLLRARFTLGFRRAFLLCSREAPCTR